MYHRPPDRIKTSAVNPLCAHIVLLVKFLEERVCGRVWQDRTGAERVGVDRVVQARRRVQTGGQRGDLRH